MTAEPAPVQLKNPTETGSKLLQARQDLAAEYATTRDRERRETRSGLVVSGVASIVIGLGVCAAIIAAAPGFLGIMLGLCVAQLTIGGHNERAKLVEENQRHAHREQRQKFKEQDRPLVTALHQVAKELRKDASRDVRMAFNEQRQKAFDARAETLRPAPKHAAAKKASPPGGG